MASAAAYAAAGAKCIEGRGAVTWLPAPNGFYVVTFAAADTLPVKCLEWLKLSLNDLADSDVQLGRPGVWQTLHDAIAVGTDDE